MVKYYFLFEDLLKIQWVNSQRYVLEIALFLKLGKYFTSNKT